MSGDDQPPMNAALEDMLARAGSVREHRLILDSWIRIAVEEYARMDGRKATANMLKGTAQWVMEAKPAKPWKP